MGITLVERVRWQTAQDARQQARIGVGAQLEKEDNAMSSEPLKGKFQGNTGPSNGGLKRRDLLLGSSTLLAASSLPVTGLVNPAQAQQANKPNIVIIWGDDIGLSRYQRLLARLDGLQDAQHRPHRALKA